MQHTSRPVTFNLVAHLPSKRRVPGSSPACHGGFSDALQFSASNRCLLSCSLCLSICPAHARVCACVCACMYACTCVCRSCSSAPTSPSCIASYLAAPCRRTSMARPTNKNKSGSLWNLLRPISRCRRDNEHQT